jgi:hypothetical protein
LPQICGQSVLPIAIIFTAADANLLCKSYACIWLSSPPQVTIDTGDAARADLFKFNCRAYKVAQYSRFWATPSPSGPRSERCPSGCRESRRGASTDVYGAPPPGTPETSWPPGLLVVVTSGVLLELISAPGPLPWYTSVVVPCVVVCVQGFGPILPEGPAISTVFVVPPVTTVHLPPANVPPKSSQVACADEASATLAPTAMPPARAMPLRPATNCRIAVMIPPRCVDIKETAEGCLGSIGGPTFCSPTVAR